MRGGARSDVSWVRGRLRDDPVPKKHEDRRLVKEVPERVVT